MNILYVADTNTRYPTNPYMVQMIEALSGARPEWRVSFGADLINWKGPAWDVLHFQWPEAVFGWKKPTVKDLAKTELRIKEHRARGGVIFTTVHNYQPHPGFEEMGKAVFDLVYSHTDCFIHLGTSSMKEFMERNRRAIWCRSAKHEVILHGDYSYYRKHYARTGMLPPAAPNQKTILVFGALRTPEEEQLAREAFYLLDDRNARLVFAGAPARRAIPSAVLEGKYDRGRIVRLHKRIPDHEVCSLFESTDVAFLPRIGRLNSGVVSLAFTFGVPVVAPSSGTMKEMIEGELGYLYAEGDATSAAEALRKSLSAPAAEREELRRRMEAYRRRNLDWGKLAEQQAALYEEARGTGPVNLLHDHDGTNDVERAICFTIALNGYDQRFKECVESQKRYCLRYGYKYLEITHLPWTVSPKQCAWLKVEILRGLLACGFQEAAFLDADCEFRPHTPRYDSVYTDGKDLYMALGKSGRVNSGIIFARNSDSVREFLWELIEKSDMPVPKEDSTAYENGHFIHYGRGNEFIGVLEHWKWNNNTALDPMSYVQHYSGGVLRRWWDDQKGQLQVPGAADKSGKPDLSAVPVSEFLAIARDYFEPILREAFQTKLLLINGDRVKEAC